MADLDRRMRDLDDIRTRDVWADALDGVENPSGRRIPEPPRGRRVVTIVVALAVAAASVIFLADRLSTTSGRPADQPTPTGSTQPVSAPVDRLAVTCGPGGAEASESSVELASDGAHLGLGGGGPRTLVAFRGPSGHGPALETGGDANSAVIALEPGTWQAACVDVPEGETFSFRDVPDTAFTASFEVIDPAHLWPAVEDASQCGEPMPDPVPTAGVEGPLAGPLTGRLLVDVTNGSSSASAAISVNADGSDPQTIATGDQNLSLGSWSPDGSQVAAVIYDSDGDPNVTNASTEDSEIYVMNADGSGRARLTDNSAADDSVDWSPDGTTLAFRSNRDRGLFLYAMNVDGSGAHRLVDLGGGENEYEGSPSWSPDGSKIAFVGSTGTPDPSMCVDDLELYVANADGTGVVRLTDDEWYESDPVWSPDATQLAFIASRQSDYAWDLFVVNADGTDMRRLTAYPGYDSAPVWSPDGTMIAFTSDRGRGVSRGEDQAGDLYVMNADGSGVQPMFPTGELYRGAASAWIADWRA